MTRQCDNLDDRRAYRDALGQFPTGVAIVTALGENRQPVGITINSFTSISMTPPLIAWGIDLRAASCGIFGAASGYTITVLARQQTELALRFARRGADKFQGIVCEGTEPPVIPGGCAWFKCEAYRSIRLGDHIMLVGKVLDFDQNAARTPLVFSTGQFHSLPSAQATATRRAA